MKKIKNQIKKHLLDLTIRYVGKNKILKKTLNVDEKEALKHLHFGFLYEKGWWKSWKKNTPIDFKGTPIPWVTYSFIDFIENRLTKDMILFEFGSGNSTFYYSSKVKNVDTVEHDIDWYNKIKKIMPNNVNLKHTNLVYGGEYSKTSINSGNKYDLIVVDGRDRVNCMINSVNALSEKGIIVLDDSERDKYKEGITKLKELGYKTIDFWGVSPGFFSYNKCTSIYYKSKNVLGI